jgi:hypothetical protein
MRTLSRPMFNMGGPIKQGIMNGIREPHAGGGRAAALVGNPIYPRTGGREHHVWNFAVPAVRALATYALGTGGKKVTQKAIQEGIKTGTKTASGTGITAAAPGFWKSAWQQDPLVRSTKWLYNAIKSPTAKGIGSKIAKTVVSPTGVIGGAWLGSSLLGGDKEDDGPPTGINKAGGYPGAGKGGGGGGMTSAQQEAFALAQRNKRVKKYLDLMGYDRSKKTAIADALIDASKIVSDRGTLDLKNITGELINPVIQATSKRLDKPEQIREAVGLMMTKAGLEKEMYEAKPGTVLKNVQDMVKSGQYTEKEAWAIATKEPRGASDVITSHMASKRGSLNAEDLAIIMRDYGAKNDVPVGVITKSDIVKEYGEGLKEYPSAMDIIEEKQITDDGIYVIGKEVIQITDGKPLQLS